MPHGVGFKFGGGLPLRHFVSSRAESALRMGGAYAGSPCSPDLRSEMVLFEFEHTRLMGAPDRRCLRRVALLPDLRVRDQGCV